MEREKADAVFRYVVRQGIWRGLVATVVTCSVIVITVCTVNGIWNENLQSFFGRNQVSGVQPLTTCAGMVRSLAKWYLFALSLAVLPGCLGGIWIGILHFAFAARHRDARVTLIIGFLVGACVACAVHVVASLSLPFLFWSFFLSLGGPTWVIIILVCLLGGLGGTTVARGVTRDYERRLSED